MELQAGLVINMVVSSIILTIVLGFLVIPLSLVMLSTSIKIFLIPANILFILLAFYIVAPPIVALINGYFYILHFFMDDRKSVLVLQV